MVDLKDFLAELATKPERLGAFIHDPEAVMKAAELSEEDRAALRSGFSAVIHARLAGLSTREAFGLTLRSVAPPAAVWPVKAPLQMPPVYQLPPQLPLQLPPVYQLPPQLPLQLPPVYQLPPQLPLQLPPVYQLPPQLPLQLPPVYQLPPQLPPIYQLPPQLPPLYRWGW